MMEFTYSSYSRLLHSFIAAGYKPTVKWVKKLEKSTVFIRHDVDILPEFCLPLANIEEKTGFISSWFFLEQNSMYSLGDSFTKSVINTLREKGHEIGLHFDAKNISSQEQMVSAIDASIERWMELLGFKPNIFSFHRPAKFGLLPDNYSFKWHEKLACTYDGVFFLGTKYFSDSNRKQLDESKIYTVLESGNPIQLLLHPLWWHENDIDHHCCPVNLM